MAKRMCATEVVRAIMSMTGESNASLGKKIGVANTAIWDRLKKNNLKVDTLVQMVSAMGYKIIAVPADKKLSAEEFELK